MSIPTPSDFATLATGAADDACGLLGESATTALAVDELDRHGMRSHEVYTAGFYQSDWDFVVRCALGKASRGGADAGEVLATIAAVDGHDHKEWLNAWTGLGVRLASVAATAAERGHRVSAARAYLRAANYFAVAVNAVDGTDDPETLLTTFRAHRAAWEGFVANTRWPVERVDIPYEGTSMPGWLFHPPGSSGARPTLVVNNGSDGSMSGAWCECTEGALERGYGVLMFDGPGQQSMFFERDVPFRPDWERVLTPVVDFLVARDDVDADRLAVYGLSQAGYWVPRALAFEHRFAAAIIDGGVVDISRSWFARIPAPLRSLYEQGRTALFDEQLDKAMQFGDGSGRRTWEFRARPYGVEGYAAVLDAVSQYRLDDVAGQIDTACYVIDPDGEQFFPGQPAELAGLIPGAARARFTQEEGASYHCQPMARELTEQRMFDWLDEQLHRAGSGGA